MRAALLLLAPLAACSASDSDYNRVEVRAQEAEAQNAIDAAVVRNGAATTSRVGVPVTEASPAARNRTLPKEFQGYWGLTPDDCELANTNATGRMNVDADTIRFFESRARVVSIAQTSPYALVAELQFRGEGETWERRTELRLENGGTNLVRGEGQPATTVRYSRC